MSRLSNDELLKEPRAALNTFTKAVMSKTLEPLLLELVQLRAAQINGCAICLQSHWVGALKQGDKVDRLSTVIVWDECDWFTDREKAALAWTEAITKTSQGRVTDDDWEAVRKEFSEEEVMDLTMCIISINSWNRLNISISRQPMHFEVPVTE